jgi:hypothetical protein
MNPSTSHANGGPNATNDESNISTLTLEEQESMTLEQLENHQRTTLDPPTATDENKGRDPPTNRSLRSMIEKENTTSLVDNSTEMEEWDELTSFVSQLEEAKNHTSPLKSDPSESTPPIQSNMTRILQASSSLLNLVLQSQRQIRELQEEIAQLKAQQQQQQQQQPQPKKRTSFDIQTSPILMDGSSRCSHHRRHSFDTQTSRTLLEASSHHRRHGYSHEWNDSSHLHGSDMNWSRRDSRHTNTNTQQQQQQNIILFLSPKPIARNVSDKSTTSSRPSEKRWKSLHVALHANNEADATATNGSKIQEFSKRSSLVFMHPEEGKEKRRKNNKKRNGPVE